MGTLEIRGLGRGALFPLMLLPNAEKRWLAVLVCYLDDSGEKSDPIITMAGFISTEDHWRQFEECARSEFDKIGLEYLHTVDLHQQRNFFSGWEREQTADFANGFCMLIKEFIPFGFEFSVLKSQYNAKKKKLGLSKHVSPLGFCFVGLADGIFKNEGILSVIGEPNVQISFVVESGHTNNQDVLARFNELKKKTNQVGSLQFQDKKEAIALQAADFIAYFSRRLRNKDPDHPRFDDEFSFFQTALDGLTMHHFLATDFFGSED